MNKVFTFEQIKQQESVNVGVNQTTYHQLVLKNKYNHFVLRLLLLKIEQVHKK